MASYSQTSSGCLCSSPVLERSPRPRGPTLCDCQSSHMLLSFDKVRSNPPAVRACPLVADCSPYIAPTPSTNSEPGAPLSQPQAERTSVSLQRLHIAPCPPSQTHTHSGARSPHMHTMGAWLPRACTALNSLPGYLCMCPSIRVVIKHEKETLGYDP